jgi:hypothetical protein
MNPVGETIVDSFFPKSVDGSEVLNEIHFQQFVRTFAVFRPIHKSKMSYLQAINSVDNKVYIFLFEQGGRWGMCGVMGGWGDEWVWKI